MKYGDLTSKNRLRIGLLIWSGILLYSVLLLHSAVSELRIKAILPDSIPEIAGEMGHLLYANACWFFILGLILGLGLGALKKGK